MTGVLVGGRKREDVLAQHRLKLEAQTPEYMEDSSPCSLHGYPSFPDVFGIGDIRKLAGRSYLLQDLDVPEGRWQQLEITLPFYSPGDDRNAVKRTWHEHIETSRSNDRDLHIMPLKVHYWCLRAIKTLKDRHGEHDFSDAAKELASVLYDAATPIQERPDQEFSKLIHADSITWRVHGHNHVEVHGWPHDHPFSQHAYSFHLKPSKEGIQNKPRNLAELCGALFGDRDVKRVRSVLGGVYHNIIENLLWAEPEHQVSCVTIERNYGGMSGVNLTETLDVPLPAHSVRADVQYFKPRKPDGGLG